MAARSHLKSLTAKKRDIGLLAKQGPPAFTKDDGLEDVLSRLSNQERHLRSSTKELDQEHIPTLSVPESLIESWKPKSPGARSASPSKRATSSTVVGVDGVAVSPNSPVSPSQSPSAGSHPAATSPGDSIGGSQNTQTRTSAKLNASPTSRKKDTLQATVSFCVTSEMLVGKQIVHCDVQRVEDCFQFDTTGYVDHQGLLLNGIEERYLDLRSKLLQKSKVVEVDVPYLTTRNYPPDTAHFHTGAFQFAVLRDLGVKTVPMLVDEDEVISIVMRFLSDQASGVVVKHAGLPTSAAAATTASTWGLASAADHTSNATASSNK